MDNLKNHVDSLLKERDFESLVNLCEKERRAWQEVRYRLYSLDERLRWSAVETAGQLMKLWWKKGREEKVRIYIRTLFWSMNEESGGIGWSSPQTVAEIIANIPEIKDPYGSMIIAHCIDEPPLLKGCLWGIGRIGRPMKDYLGYFSDRLLEVFESENPEELGLLSWAMGEAGFIPAKPYLESLLHIDDNIIIYITGVFHEKSVSQWAEEAISRLSIL